MPKEFRSFALRGNVVDLAVAVIIGTAFGTIVTSLVKDVLMPPTGLLLGGVDFTNLYAVLKEGTTPGPYATLAAAREAGATTVAYGLFLNTVVSFTIVAFVMFMVIRTMNKAKRKLDEMDSPEPLKAPTMKECPFCRSSIAVQAIRCAHCTSNLEIIPASASRN